MWNIAPRENKSSASGKRGFHPCFCLPACCNCPVALSEFAALILIIQLCLNLTASKNAIAAGKTDCKIKFASQMWATRPHLGSIFKKLLDQKTFVCLRLVLGIPPESGSARLGHIPSLPKESQLPLKPCISLQPSDFEGNCDSLRFSPRFSFHLIIQFHLLRKRGLLAHTSAAFL